MLFKINLQLLSLISTTTTAPSDTFSYVADTVPFFQIIPSTDSRTFRGYARKLLNYLKQLPESKFHAIFDFYSNEGNKNSLSKWKATLFQECLIEDLSKNLSRVAKQCLNTLLVDVLLSVNVDFGKEIYVTKGKRCFQASPNTSSQITEMLQLKSNQLETDPRIVFYAAFSSSREDRRVVCKEADDDDAYGLVLYILLYCHREVYFGQGNGSAKDSVTYPVKTVLGSHIAEVFAT